MTDNRQEKADGKMFSRLVEKAKQGDNGAIADLYEQTYDRVFYTVRSMIKDEDTAFDIVQDSYMKAFAHLESFQGGEKFPAWMKMIAANTARDWLKRQRPVLFSELNTAEDMDEPAEAQFVDSRSENQPEWVLEQQETKRLLGEILDGLPEDQRAVIGMYYYEELSVKDIAAAMGCSESAVKSRLLYGRKKVEKEVRALEKKGTKLYGLAGIPFLLWLFRSQDVYAAERPGGKAVEQILQAAQTAQQGSGVQTGSGMHAGGFGGAAAQAAKKAGAGTAAVGGAGAAAMGGAGAAGGTAAGLGGLKLGLIVAAAVAVVGGSVFGIVKAVNKDTPQQAIVTVYEGTGERLPDAGQKESGPREDPAKPGETEKAGTTEAPRTQAAPQTVAVPTTPEETKDPGKQALEEALQIYREVIAKADTYDFNVSPDLTATGYEYALVQLEPGDPVPALLLSKCFEEYYYQCRVFYYDSGTKTLWQPADTLTYGMSLAGYRGGLAQEADGRGLANSEFSAGSGMGSYTRVTMKNGALIYEAQWSGRLDQDGQPETVQIGWMPREDESGFKQWDAGGLPSKSEDGSGESSPASGQAIGPQAETLPSDGNRIVFTGSVKRFTYDEVVELQGMPDPNAAWSNHHQTYILLVLDEPAEMSICLGDEQRLHEGTVSVIRLPESCSGYIGTHHIFSIDPWKTYWPTDTSLPLGSPTTGNLKILD